MKWEKKKQRSNNKLIKIFDFDSDVRLVLFGLLNNHWFVHTPAEENQI